jgi:CDP-paratose synthetase
MRKSRILITGATGFLGSRLAIALVQLGYDVTILKRPGSDVSRLAKVISDCRVEEVDDGLFERIQSYPPEIILHTATAYGRKGESEQEIIRANIDFPLQLLEWASHAGLKTFINTHTSLPEHTNLYASSKHRFREKLNSYDQGLEVINVIPEYFFGPGDDHWKFITMVFKEIAKKSPSIPLSSGEQLRDFIFIDDVVAAYITLADHSGSHSGCFEYPVGSGDCISIRDLVETCGSVSENHHTEFLFGALPSRQADADMKRCDTSALQALGWTCRTSLREGLDKTWYQIKQDIFKHGSK